MVSEPLVSPGGGMPMSVVDSGTLVVKVVDVLDGVMIMVVFSRVVVSLVTAVVVVRTVSAGLLHSSDIVTTI
ncbi:hypothetical protein MCNF_42300 [Mycolicibacterium confluentis]|uniref:Uncharacterized protein n=1 Tax=Mycolicibacterium confluentis TaxID=28047 RepID=A0A7I7Y1W5_9MYCO|nr:hypothetical protein MCNF_42300 [Mycolicibacterium confluentis]